jgi:hypothetical protein
MYPRRRGRVPAGGVAALHIERIMARLNVAAADD